MYYIYVQSTRARRRSGRNRSHPRLARAACRFLSGMQNMCKKRCIHEKRPTKETYVRAKRPIIYNRWSHSHLAWAACWFLSGMHILGVHKMCEGTYMRWKGPTTKTHVHAKRPIIYILKAFSIGSSGLSTHYRPTQETFQRKEVPCEGLFCRSMLKYTGLFWQIYHTSGAKYVSW